MKQVIILILVFIYHIMIIFKDMMHSFLSKIRNCWYSRIEGRHYCHYGKGSFIAPTAKIVGHQYISILENTVLGEYSYLTAWQGDGTKPTIEIGALCSFGAWNHITGINKIVIGNHVLTGNG